MKRVTRYFLFLMASVVNVQVQGKSSVLQLPENCSQEVSGLCSIKALKGRGLWEQKEWKVEYGQHSILKRENDGVLRLIKGQFFIQAQEKTIIESKYSKVKLEKGDYVWVELGFDRDMIATVSGDVEVNDLNGGEHKLPAAYSNWFAKINGEGEVNYGSPQPLNFKKLIRHLASISQMEKRQIVALLEGLHDLWVAAIDETQKRSLASSIKLIEQDKLRKKQVAKRLAEIQMERKRIREFFYKKTFLE